MCKHMKPKEQNLIEIFNCFNSDVLHVGLSTAPFNVAWSASPCAFCPIRKTKYVTEERRNLYFVTHAMYSENSEFNKYLRSSGQLACSARGVVLGSVSCSKILHHVGCKGWELNH